MIQTKSLTKRYGKTLAVDSLTITVEPGKVTGFLGPNGAGKSTTMRMILGLDHPTSGSAKVNGHLYQHLKRPLHEVGALLDARALSPGRTARNHLLALAATHGISKTRVEEVIELTGLRSVATRKAGSYSLGMAQRLGIAVALLGDPKTLILDEPVNGLDPEGVRWVRDLVRHLAGLGKTVFLSSHLMSEMEQTADHLIVLARGKLLADVDMAEFISQSSEIGARVRTPYATQMADWLAQPGVRIDPLGPDLIEVHGLDAAQLGDAAATQGWALHELIPLTASLEQAYLDLTNDATEYRSESFEAHVGQEA
ncbi:MAG: ATP-binding cassette domain-containing protein [Propionibacteriaceae bacterium]|jgi:ABC-2 type transport system ATP-binding protein|nr:ATP-binding cassette domain-containing protein [Propionibacteriaceae bacterium]